LNYTEFSTFVAGKKKQKFLLCLKVLSKQILSHHHNNCHASLFIICTLMGSELTQQEAEAVNQPTASTRSLAAEVDNLLNYNDIIVHGGVIGPSGGVRLYTLLLYYILTLKQLARLL
jgi:hypothetical protein